jgi:co-chaperonin GroES (HSP10)
MENFKAQALNYNIIVKREFLENRTGAGIILDSEIDKNEKYRKGIVVSVGNLCPKDADGNATIKPGDEILYDKYKMSEVTLDGQSYEIISYADLVLIL